MSSYLTLRDRFFIEDLLRVNTPVKIIASKMGRCFSTIYKEIKKGQTEVVDTELRPRFVYSAVVAHDRHVLAQTSKGRPIKLGSDYAFASYIRDKIVIDKYSPAAALASARKENFSISICLATLYKYIDRYYLPGVTNDDLLYKSLQQKRDYKSVKRVSHPQFPSISDRPEHINIREEPGHWEMDLIVGKKYTKPVLLVLTERVTRYELIYKLACKSTVNVINALDKLERRLTDFKEIFKSITVDNGSEFLDYTGLCRSVFGGKRCEVYYCHPYTSCERGSNENANRIIRRWIPKGEDIGNYSDEDIKRIQDWLNHYPRKIHGYASAADCAKVCLSA